MKEDLREPQIPGEVSYSGLRIRLIMLPSGVSGTIDFEVKNTTNVNIGKIEFTPDKSDPKSAEIKFNLNAESPHIFDNHRALSTICRWAFLEKNLQFIKTRAASIDAKSKVLLTDTGFRESKSEGGYTEYVCENYWTVVARMHKKENYRKILRKIFGKKLIPVFPKDF